MQTKALAPSDLLRTQHRARLIPRAGGGMSDVYGIGSTIDGDEHAHEEQHQHRHDVLPERHDHQTVGTMLLPPPVPVPHATRLRDWLTTLGYLLLCLYANVLVQVLVDARWFALVEANSGVIPPPLMDLGFEWLPRLPYHPIIGLTAPLFTIVMICVLYLRTGRWFNDLFRQALWISATNFLLRACTLHLTLLPPSLADCMQPAHLSPLVKSWSLHLRPLLVLSGHYATCTDAFFSGHAANLTVDLFFWFYWVVMTDPFAGIRPTVRRLLTFFMLFAYAFSLYMIIASRFHYTIDVLIGVWVAWTVCYAYYYLYPPLRHI